VTMLTSTVIRLRATQNGWLPRAMGEYGHAAFLSLIREVAPDLSKALHGAGTRQPYTVSPLVGGKRERRGVSVRSGNSCWMRFTILDPALYAVFSRYFAESTSFDLALKLGEMQFIIEEVTTSRQSDGWSAFSLGEVDGCGPRFCIFPEPALVFDSLLRRWNQFADQPLVDPGEWQKWVNEHVIVRRYQAESDLWQFRQHPQIGFVGSCTYEVKANYPSEIQRLNALVDFSFFAGVGCKTTMGLGQCKRIEQ